MNARLMLERIDADDRLVGLHRKAGDRRDQAGCLGDVFGDDPGLHRHDVAAGLDRHDDLFHRGIAGALADAVDGAFHLARTGLDRTKTVGNREAQIVVAMHRDHRLVDVRHTVLDHADEIRELLGIGVADGVRDVDGGGASGDRAFDTTTKEIMLGPRAVLTGPLDVIDMVSRARHAVNHRLMHLIGRHLQLDAHMQRAGGDERVDALSLGRLQGLRRTIDIWELRAGQRADHAVLDPFCDLVDRLEVTLGSDRETRFDDVDAHLLQEFGDLDFLGHGHGGARRLLAVAKGRVEHDDLVGSCGDLGYFGLHGFSILLFSRHGS